MSGIAGDPAAFCCNGLGFNLGLKVGWGGVEWGGGWGGVGGGGVWGMGGKQCVTADSETPNPKPQTVADLSRTVGIDGDGDLQDRRHSLELQDPGA